MPENAKYREVCETLKEVCQEHDRLLLFADEKADAPDKVGTRLQELAAKFIEDGVAGVVFHPVDYCPNAADVNREIVGTFARAKVPVVLLDCDLACSMQSGGLDQVGVDKYPSEIAPNTRAVDECAML